MQIGNAIMDGGSMLLNLVKDVEPVKNKKILHVLKFNFDCKRLELQIDCDEEMQEKSALKYLFIGSAPGANSPQWYATTNNPFFHISETIANLENKIDLGKEINNKVHIIKDNFYMDLGSEFKSPKNRYILDFKKFGISERSGIEELEELKEQSLSEKEIKDKLKKIFLKQLDDYLKSKFNLSIKEIALSVILIDDKPLCQSEEYKQAVLKEKSVVETSNRNNSNYCNICGSQKSLTSKFDTELKFYTTNQVIFANNLDPKNYSNNYSMCEDCMNKVLVAEKYMINNLNTRLADFTVYLLPDFVIGEPLNKEDLDNCSVNIKNSFNTVVSFESIENLKSSIEDFISYERENNSFYLLNLLFYKRSQKSTKVQKLIKDVNPSIFIDIGSAINKSFISFKSIFGENFSRAFNLNKVYYLVPIRIKSGELMQYRKLLSFYESIFLKREIKKTVLISSITQSCKALYFKQNGLNVTDRGSKTFNLDDRTAALKLLGTIIDGMMFIKFLEELGCVKEGKAMDTSKLKLEEGMKKHIEEIGYNEQQTSLFLLGNIIGAIGNAQYKRSSDGKKPILNKLNFNGMDKSKLVRLSNEIFNKLRQEKILQYNEMLYGQFKELFDKNRDSWTLNKDENLFYILSGYGYYTNKAIMGERKGNNHE